MYRKYNQSEVTPENFELSFAEKLSSDNRWAGLTSSWGNPRRQPLVIMAELIPWSEFEEEYAENFSEKMGAIAKPFRMALGALIIKEKLGTSDRETVEQIRENPYLQYFLWMSGYSNEAPFDASMMVYFRERIDKDLINKINEKMLKNLREKEEEETEKKTKKKKLSQSKIKES
jgi:transposase, IS5 family